MNDIIEMLRNGLPAPYYGEGVVRKDEWFDALADYLEALEKRVSDIERCAALSVGGPLQ